MSEIEQLKKKISQVEKMPYPALCEKFRSLYGNIVCPTNKTTLKNRIIYKLQELMYGGISEGDRFIIDEVKRSLDNKQVSKTKCGTTSHIHYFREWRGQKYDVAEIAKNCFLYNGIQYKSLTAVATAITGTHWNGKAFFGVNK